MAEIKGYLLTAEEEKACAELVEKLRERKVFAVDFSGYIRIKAKTSEEASDIFWKWVGDLQDTSLSNWSEVIAQFPHFENDGVEEDE